MAGGAKADFKLGLWAGLGVAVAFLLLGLLQAMTLRAVHRNG